MSDANTPQQGMMDTVGMYDDVIKESVTNNASKLRPDDDALFRDVNLVSKATPFEWGDAQVVIPTWVPSSMRSPNEVDVMKERRGVYSTITNPNFDDAVLKLATVTDLLREKLTTWKDRQELTTDLRYHPLGVGDGEYPYNDVWAYPTAGYFQGMPVGAIISSNMEYAQQNDQVASLIQRNEYMNDQAAWLDDLYRKNSGGGAGMEEAAVEPVQLLESIIVPQGASLYESDDNQFRSRELETFDDGGQEQVTDAYATVPNNDSERQFMLDNDVS
jgi:hypothetical protein